MNKRYSIVKKFKGDCKKNQKDEMLFETDDIREALTEWRKLRNRNYEFPMCKCGNFDSNPDHCNSGVFLVDSEHRLLKSDS